MTPEQRFQEAKKQSQNARALSRYAKSHFTLWQYSEAMAREAEAFRAKVKAELERDIGQDLGDLGKFSWEE